MMFESAKVKKIQIVVPICIFFLIALFLRIQKIVHYRKLV